MPMIRVRPVTIADRAMVLAVEGKSTPNLRYLPDVYDMFMNDPGGELFLAEYDGEIVACAKFTRVPDGSAWLETLRVVPAYQGRGVGKRLYDRYFQLAKASGVQTMRMYTGIKNAVSKGLAEQFGFTLEQTFLGYARPCVAIERPVLSSVAKHQLSETVDRTNTTTDAPVHAFERITEPSHAAELLLPHAAAWANFLVMNRTFYKLDAALCHYLAARGEVYAEPASGSVMVLGARFQPHEALHIGMFVGDSHACIHFAEQQALERGTQQLSCLFPIDAPMIEQTLQGHGFTAHASPYIVMRWQAG